MIRSRMAADYISEIRALQPEGPYYLGGSSFGGMVAYKISQQLRAKGQEVAVSALFDTMVLAMEDCSPQQHILGKDFMR